MRGNITWYPINTYNFYESLKNKVIKRFAMSTVKTRVDEHLMKSSSCVLPWHRASELWGPLLTRALIPP